MIEKHPLSFQESYRRKKIIDIESIEIYIASIDGLIIMKSTIGRPQDLSDVALLKKAKKWTDDING